MDRNTTQTQPKISVVIPFYRHADWLAEAVESVLEQDYGNCEILVVNDGSPEDTDEFLRRFGDDIVYVKKENGGPASARNEGLRRATGDYIAFLDSDDLWTGNKLAVQLRKMEEYGALWSISDYELFGEEIPAEYRQVVPGGCEKMIDTIPPYIATPTVMITRSLLTDNDYWFCDGLRFGQDAVLWEQLFHTAPALYLPEKFARVRIRGTNAGKRAAVQLHARVEMYDKCVELIPGYRESKSRLFRFSIALCRFGKRFVSRDSVSKGNEFAARVLFALPYLLFRLDRKRA